MEFSESSRSWSAIPDWASFLIRLGIRVGQVDPGCRRIYLVSMPCESAAAGVIALGALLHRLSLKDSNDSSSHLARLRSLASENEPEVFLVHEVHGSGFRPEFKNGILWGRRDPIGNKSMTRIAILPNNSAQWRVNGEPAVHALSGSEIRFQSLYDHLSAGISEAFPSNYSLSDSGVCLAGRVAGESISRSVYSAIRFRNGCGHTDLSSLLTVHAWSPGTISRLTYFNSRTGQFDRQTGLTRVVIADGDTAFLRVLDVPDFRTCDILGVIQKTIDRGSLEAVGVKLADLAQWYAADDERTENLGAVPRGVTISSLRRR